jgi:hypothetical protein
MTDISASTGRCARGITISSCPMPAGARRWLSPWQPMGAVQPREGGRARQPWWLDSPSRAGACEKYGCAACRRGPSRRRSQQRCQVMLVALNGGGGLRGTPGGQEEVLQTGFESG